MGINFNLEVHLLSKFIVNEFDGIKLCNLKEKNTSFDTTIIQSLKFINELEIRRYKRIRKEVSWIINTNSIEKYGGRYKRKNKTCDINFHDYCEDTKLVSLYYAGLIIHEATHGHLFAKGFEYKTENRLQIERICTAEENRFYKKVEFLFPEYEGLLYRDFNSKNWNYLWNTPKHKIIYDKFKRILQN